MPKKPTGAAPMKKQANPKPGPGAKDKVTIAGKAGKKPITFNKGGLHKSTGTPMGQKIPASKMAKAKSGGYGPKAMKQASLAKGLAKMRKK